MASKSFFPSAALLCGLLASSISVQVIHAAILPRQAVSPNVTTTASDAVPTVTATPIALPSTAFGSAIEGVAVNANGDVFAADFRAGNLTPSSSYGYFFEREVGATDVLDLSANPIFNAAASSTNDTTENPPLLAGGRFLGDGSLLLTGKHKIFLFFIFCDLGRWFVDMI